jgi:hypothetical protein
MPVETTCILLAIQALAIYRAVLPRHSAQLVLAPQESPVSAPEVNICLGDIKYSSTYMSILSVGGEQP